MKTQGWQAAEVIGAGQRALPRAKIRRQAGSYQGKVMAFALWPP
jgi:hypothetical protein